MQTPPDSCFLEMIQTLSRREGVVLYNDILEISPAEADAVVAFLNEEYERESLDHPHTTPSFHPDAARWAAQTVYVAAQLILYRKHEEKDVPSLLPSFSSTPDAAAILSADLCLRFLPDMIVQLKIIDANDTLIPLLESILKQWHFSGVRHHLAIELLDFAPVVADVCLHQLYCYRIVDHRKLPLAQHPVFRDAIAAQMGMYGTEFWNEFKTDTLSSLA